MEAFGALMELASLLLHRKNLFSFSLHIPWTLYPVGHRAVHRRVSSVIISHHVLCWMRAFRMHGKEEWKREEHKIQWVIVQRIDFESKFFNEIIFYHKFMLRLCCVVFSPTIKREKNGDRWNLLSAQALVQTFVLWKEVRNPRLMTEAK